MKLNKFEWAAVFYMLFIATALVGTVIMITLVFSGYQDCSSEGGVYARTLLGFVCIK